MEVLVDKLNSYSKNGIPQLRSDKDEDLEECKLISINYSFNCPFRIIVTTFMLNFSPL